MELDGLKNVLRRLDYQNLSPSSLTTDGHKQVLRYIRQKRKEINCQFDVRRIGRNIKKLIKASKKKPYQELNQWIKSIINHFWWSCASCNGSEIELKEKLASILHHITDTHHWKGSTIYKKCQHKRLSKKRNASQTLFIFELATKVY